MNTDQVQSLLNRYGFDAGRPDGDYGPQTRMAVIRFQTAYCGPPIGANRAGWLEVDGKAGPATWAALGWTRDTGKLAEHFTVDECRCKHCGRSGIHREFLSTAELLRASLGGRPTAYHSLFRCREHNAAIGGASSSMHVQGRAGDPAFPLTVRVAQSIDRIKGIGFKHPDTVTHIDVRPQNHVVTFYDAGNK